MCMREEIVAMLKNKPAPMTEDGPPIRGAIVNVGSVASKVAEPLNIAYTASKHVRIHCCSSLFLSFLLDSFVSSSGRQRYDQVCR